MYFHVIMPLGSDPQASEKYEIIQRIATEKKLNAHFPNYSKETPSFDLDRTIQELQGAEFVIVDLSLERPSCYYELGLVEILKKTTYLIAKTGTDIHQTSSRDNVAFFQTMKDFEETIYAILC